MLWHLAPHLQAMDPGMLSNFLPPASWGGSGDGPTLRPHVLTDQIGAWKIIR